MLQRGTVLAILAVFCQAVVAMLPMSAHAQAGLGKAAFCGPAVPADDAASSKGKASPHALPACPICQAFHLAGQLVPPDPVGLAAGVAGPGWRPLPAAATCAAQLHFLPQQARAPPSV